MPKRRKRHNGPTQRKLYGFVPTEGMPPDPDGAVDELVAAGFLTPIPGRDGELAGYAMTTPRRPR